MKKLAYNTKTHCIDIVDVIEDNKVLVAKDTYKTIDELTDYKFYDITADNAESILKELSHSCVVFANSSIQNIKDTDILMMRMNMIDDLGVMDKALDTLYRVLADKLEEE